MVIELQWLNKGYVTILERVHICDGTLRMQAPNQSGHFRSPLVYTWRARNSGTPPTEIRFASERKSNFFSSLFISYLKRKNIKNVSRNTLRRHPLRSLKSGGRKL